MGASGVGVDEDEDEAFEDWECREVRAFVDGEFASPEV